MVAEPELDTGPRQAEPAPPEAEGLVGRILARTYRLERLLVEGGMGAVYLGRHLRTGGLCAVKVLHQRAAEKSEIYERFQDEARISCALRHPNIVQVTDLDQDEGTTPFLVMELLEGEDLQERLDRDLRLSLLQSLSLARQVSSALYAAHCQGIVHRDLKPQNIYLARTEVAGQMVERVKVLDFGLSKVPRPADRVTRDLLVLGTPRYLAPEAAQGQNSKLDGRADQFSLGVILYRALSGRLPFDGDDVAEVLHQVVFHRQKPLALILPTLPGHVSMAIERALSKRKEDRFDTIKDFVKALCNGERELQREISGATAAPAMAISEAPTQSLVSAAQLGSAVSGPRALGLPQVARFGQGVAGPGDREAPGSPESIGRPLLMERCAVAALLGAIASLPLLLAIGIRPTQPGPAAGLRQPAELLRQADGLFAARRWKEAAAVSARALALPAPDEAAPWRKAAHARKGQAEAEERAPKSYEQLHAMAAQKSYERLHAMAAQKDLTAALEVFWEIPPGSVYRKLALETEALLFARFSQAELSRAEAAREKGRCDEFASAVQRVLEVMPDQPQALSERWRPCPPEEAGGPGMAIGQGSGQGQVPNSGVTRPELLAYPPLRTGDAYGAAASYGKRRTLDTADQLLVDAERLYDQGRYTAATERAHLLLREGKTHRQRALRVIGAAACAQGKAGLAVSTYDQLEGETRASMAEDCQRPPQQGQDNGRAGD